MSIIFSGPLAPNKRNIAYAESLRPHVGVVMPWLIAPVDYLPTSCDECGGAMWLEPVEMALRDQLSAAGSDVRTYCFYDAVAFSQARVLLLRGLPGSQ